MELIWVSQFVLLMTQVFIGSGSALHIAVSPHTYTEKSVGSVNVTCSLDGTDAGVKTIVLLEILRNGGHPMVILQVTGLTYGVGYSDPDKFQAEGLLDTDVANSYLRLSIHNPNEADAGLYSCKLIYLDSHGIMTEHRASGNLTVEELDINAAVRDLLDEVAALKQRNSVLEKKLQDQTTKVSDETKALWDKSQALDERTENHTRMMNHLEERSSYNLAFSASLTGPTSTSGGEDMVFGNVITRIGKGYDETTGVFTAPRDGTFVFHLFMKTYDYCCYTYIDLKANDKVIVSLFVEVTTKDDDIQSSVSSVVQLEQGDRVKAVAGGGSMHWVTGTWSVFTGYLIHV